MPLPNPSRARVRQAWTLIVIQLTLGVVSFTTGCTHPVLGRPAFLGASVTSGFGASVTAPTESEPPVSVPVTLALAYEAVVTASTSPGMDFSNTAVMLDPMTAMREQAATASARRPSIVIAIDWLFWPLHQSLPTSTSEEERAQIRLAAVDSALLELERFECPVIVGDVPAMPEADGIISVAEAPGDAIRAEANARLHRWAARSTHRFVIPVSELLAAAAEETLTERLGFTVTPIEERPFVQTDGLHATEGGLVVLASAVVAELEAAGLIEPGLRLLDEHQIDVALANAALQASSRDEPGLLEMMSLASIGLEFQAAGEAGDDTRAAELGAQLLDRFEAFPIAPTGFAGDTIRQGLETSADYALYLDFPQTQLLFQRYWRALQPRTLGDRPDPWLLELWIRYSRGAGTEQMDETIKDLAARGGRMGGWPPPYERMLWQLMPTLNDSALAYVFPDPDRAFDLACVDARLTKEWIESVPEAYANAFGRHFPFAKSLLIWDAFSGYHEASVERKENMRTDRFVNRILDSEFAEAWSVVTNWRSLFDYLGAIENGNLFFQPKNAPIFLLADWAADDDHRRQTPAPQPQIPLPFSDVETVPDYLSPGFGWADGLAGAVASLPGQRDDFIFTRASLDDQGQLRLTAEPLPDTWAAAEWTRLHHPGTDPEEQAENPTEAMVAAIDIPEIGFTRASLIAAAQGPQKRSGPSEEHHAAGTILAIGTARSAAVRWPAGIDATDGSIRWVRGSVADTPMVVLGGVDERFADSRDALGVGRLHAVWMHQGSLVTAEITGLEGFMPGRSPALERAILDQRPEELSTTDPLGWLPDSGLEIIFWPAWTMLPTISTTRNESSNSVETISD